MMKHAVRTAVGIAALAAATANADTFLFEAVINGAQEVPPTTSAANGTLTGIFDDATNTFSFAWDISGPLSGTPTVSHIHGAAPAGVNAGVLFGFNNPGPTWPLQGAAIWSNMTQANIDALFAGNTYANFHTTAFPGGEVRGQITLVPAPGAAALLGLGGLAMMRRRR